MLSVRHSFKFLTKKEVRKIRKYSSDRDAFVSEQERADELQKTISVSQATVIVIPERKGYRNVALFIISTGILGAGVVSAFFVAPVLAIGGEVGLLSVFLVTRNRLVKKHRIPRKNKSSVIVETISHPSETESSLVEHSVPEIDQKKRLFLKLAGIVGLGVAASTMLPKKAEALVFGSTPASNTVGVKDENNVRITPAKETGGNLASIKTNTDNLAGIKTGTDNLAAIKTNTDKFTFTGGALQTISTGGASVVGLKDAQDNRISPVTDDTVILLRRMVKLMESQATVDTVNRQRITVDAWSGNVATGTGTSAASGLTLVPRVVLATDSTVGTVTSVTNVVTIGSYAAAQMFGDVAHGVYANAIRRNLVFS